MERLGPLSTWVALLLASAAFANAQSPEAFVWPGHGIAAQRPVWGHRDGLRIGLAPTPGPRGLIRIYAPYLEQAFPRVVNFLSIEPSVKGGVGRGQSELEPSRELPGQRGLSFWASNELRSAARPSSPVAGNLDLEAGKLTLFIHTEPFRNGAIPIVEIVFHHSNTEEIEIVLHAASQSAAMQRCVVSATMGNYGLLRRLHLADSRVIAADRLWQGEQPGKWGFLAWRTWNSSQIEVAGDGRFLARLASDVLDLSTVKYDPRVAHGWHYRGRLATHYWRAEKNANPVVAVNGRRRYWMSEAPIPGGTAFENFELRMPFEEGQRLWFGIQAD